MTDTPAKDHVEPIGYLKSRDILAVSPIFIYAEERNKDWMKAVFTVPVYTAPPPPQPHVEGPQPCGIADPSTRDCPNMKEVGGGMAGERYRCAVCGKGYFLDYEDMK